MLLLGGILARAAVTEDHRLGGLNHNLFLTIGKLGVPRSAELGSDEDSLLDYRQQTSHCILT